MQKSTNLEKRLGVFFSLLAIGLFLGLVGSLTYQLSTAYGPLIAGAFLLLQIQVFLVLVALGIQSTGLTAISFALHQLIGATGPTPSQGPPPNPFPSSIPRPPAKD